MTEKSWIWDGDSGSGGVGDCGPYAGNDYDDINELMWTGPNAASAGVRPRYGDELIVSAGAGKVTVGTGAAIVKGKPYKNTASVDVTVPTPSSATRYDVIVLRADYSAQTIRIYRIAGTEGGSVPAITQSDGVTWDLPLATIMVTVGGVITINEDRRRPIDQGMGAMPGEVRLWEGSLSDNAYPIISSMIWDEWRAMNTSTTYNGHTIRDYSDRAPMGVGTLVTSVGDTAGAATKDMTHTHGPGTLATDTAASHNHAINTEQEFSGTYDSTGTDTLHATPSHNHGGYTVGAGSHSHAVDSGVTASGGSATQDVLNPVFGTYFIKYCPA